MGNAITARLAPDRRGPWTVESPHPQRQGRVQDRIERGLSNRGSSSINMWEGPMPQQQPWSDFTAAKLLPDSVYLWACDESQHRGSRPSRSDAWVAWITIITQMICYLQLIAVSSGDDPATSSSADEVASTANAGSYTFFSVAAAMYLMTSIAAADLGAGIALISEARMDMAAKRWVQRKMFGFMLLVSFALLSGASVMVLFKTSSEDVDLVVGAATVLFIADVDEKVMVVLKVIPSKWRLFWVLELIGLSAALALLGLRATGNGEDVSSNDDDDGGEEKRLIYSWYFILCIYPVSVTLVSLLVNAIVASPNEFAKKHVLGNYSRQDWLFAFVLVLWIVTPFLALSGNPWVSTVMQISFFIQSMIGTCWLFFMCKRLVCCRGSNRSNAGYMIFRWTSSMRFGMVYVPVGLFLVRLVLDILTIKLNHVWWESLYQDSDENWVVILDAFHYALFHMWLVWCMGREGSGCAESPEMPSSPEPSNIVVTEATTESHEEGDSYRLTRNLFFGWVEANALINVYLLLMVVILFFGNRWLFLLLSATYWFFWILVGVCTAASSTKGVAFWSSATYMLYIVVGSIWVWRYDDDELKIINLDFS